MRNENFFDSPVKPFGAAWKVIHKFPLLPGLFWTAWSSLFLLRSLIRLKSVQRTTFFFELFAISDNFKNSNLIIAADTEISHWNGKINVVEIPVNLILVDFSKNHWREVNFCSFLECNLKLPEGSLSMYLDTIFPYWLGSLLRYPWEECHFVKYFVLKRNSKSQKLENKNSF